MLVGHYHPGGGWVGQGWGTLPFPHRGTGSAPPRSLLQPLMATRGRPAQRLLSHCGPAAKALGQLERCLQELPHCGWALQVQAGTPAQTHPAARP